MWHKTAKAGDPVVCLANKGYKFTIPVIGKVYILRDLVIVPPGFIQSGMAGFHAEGVPYTHNDDGIERGWFCRDFRPAKTTDLPASIRNCLTIKADQKEKIDG